MTGHLLLKLLLLGLAGLLLALDARAAAKGDPGGPASRRGLAALALLNLGFMAFLWFDHVRFPLTLDVMEFDVLQHVHRLVQHQYIYTRPAADFVALAYNPLYYVLAVPFVRLLGENLFALRLLAILGMLGSMVLVFAAVRGQTRSAWWGLLAAGLFAAAYRAMDAYLDTAHCDPWLVFSALLGTWLIGRSRSRTSGLLGVLVLVASFWFKQHGALFALGGVLFLTMRDGWRRALPAWVLAALLGPALYVAGGNAMFGPWFHFFTWQVPQRWSVYDVSLVLRVLTFLGEWYALLALAAAAAFVLEARERGRRMSAWHFQLVPALLTGLMGALDAGSSNNVFISMGVWIILVGTMGVAALAERLPRVRAVRLDRAALLLSFVLLAYNPLPMIVSPRARTEYADLVGTLKSLPGTVYAPWIGQLAGDYHLWPSGHWVSIEDMMGEHGSPHSPIFHEILGPAFAPGHAAWVLTNAHLETYRCLALLHDRYVLAQDFGDRFRELKGLPRRWNHAWPRYLYRYAPPGGAR
jgi:hypothetical protein